MRLGREQHALPRAPDETLAGGWCIDDVESSVFLAIGAATERLKTRSEYPWHILRTLTNGVRTTPMVGVKRDDEFSLMLGGETSGLCRPLIFHRGADRWASRPRSDKLPY